MRILLFAYYFPPDPQVGGLRAANVANALAAAGHTVRVLAAAHDGLESTVALSNGITVERIRVMPGVRELYAAVKRMLSVRKQDRNSINEVAGPIALPKQIARWKRYLFSIIWLPDDRKGWIVPVVRRAHKHIRAGADTVYTTAPPFSVNLAGLILRKLHRITWVAEYRDPWIGDESKPVHVSSRAADAVESWLERRCLATADRVVAVTDATAALIQQKLPAPAVRRVAVVRNGIARIEPATAATPGKEVRIVYAGTLYFGRDPRAFLTALAVLRATGRLTRGVRVDFVGECRWYYEVSIEALVQKLGIADRVHFTDWLPRDAVQTLIDQADVLLLLAQKQPLQVPNKLYDYLGARKTILTFADADGESARMLRRIGGHVVVDSVDPAQVEAAVETAINRPLENAGHEYEQQLREWTTSHQMQLLCQCLEMQPV